MARTRTLSKPRPGLPRECCSTRSRVTDGTRAVRDKRLEALTVRESHAHAAAARMPERLVARPTTEPHVQRLEGPCRATGRHVSATCAQSWVRRRRVPPTGSAVRWRLRHRRPVAGRSNAPSAVRTILTTGSVAWTRPSRRQRPLEPRAGTAPSIGAGQLVALELAPPETAAHGGPRRIPSPALIGCDARCCRRTAGGQRPMPVCAGTTGHTRAEDMSGRVR